MSIAKRIAAGCVLTPILLIASCAAKMSWDSARYELPGPVLQSSLKPTQKLETPTQVAEALDAYVQPRFEILRDKNFGALRIVYRKHAGIVQLKVETQQEKEAIANINAAHRDYMICLLHCVSMKGYADTSLNPRLQLLYCNQKPVAGAPTYLLGPQQEVAAANKFDMDEIQAQAVEARAKWMAGKEHRTTSGDWTVLMRPVLASKQECLSCHTDAKIGATLGVMVYGVRNSRNPVSAKIGMR